MVKRVSWYKLLSQAASGLGGGSFNGAKGMNLGNEGISIRSICRVV